MKYNCFYCKEDFNKKDMSHIRVMKKSGRGRGRCRDCNSAMARNNYLYKKIEKDPENYISCDACDMDMHKYKAGPGKIERTNCIYCGSDKIGSYA